MSKIKVPAEPQDIRNFGPLQVEVGSNFEESLRRFRSMVQKSKVLSLYKEKQQFEKPSEKKRRKKREAQERMRLLEIRDRQISSGEWEKKQQRKNNKKEWQDEYDDYDE